MEEEGGWLPGLGCRPGLQQAASCQGTAWGQRKG